MKDSVKAAIQEIIDEEYGRFSEKDGDCFIYEMYADYRDEMPNSTASYILKSEDPEQAFEETLDHWYEDARWQYEDELLDKIVEKLSGDDELFPDGFDEDENEIREYMQEHIFFDVPRDHFLEQKFEVDIMLDTGDGNYDYSLNAVYPCWYGREEDYHNSKASVVWLAKQQGYGKRVFRKAMNEGDSGEHHSFLNSMRQELANLPSHMSTVTFLVSMTLKELIELNRLIRLQDRNGRFYDATKKPYCGYIIIDKKTVTGLYDPWCGGGSVFEIELEKDVRIPVRFIRSALPDGGIKHEYSVGEVYGMCGSAWKDTVKLIHAPVKFLDDNEVA